MKRLILATMAVLLVAGILGTVSALDTCPVPSTLAPTTDLLAGQKTDIGDVYVLTMQMSSMWCTKSPLTAGI